LVFKPGPPPPPGGKSRGKLGPKIRPPVWFPAPLALLCRFRCCRLTAGAHRSNKVCSGLLTQNKATSWAFPYWGRVVVGLCMGVFPPWGVLVPPPAPPPPITLPEGWSQSPFFFFFLAPPSRFFGFLFPPPLVPPPPPPFPPLPQKIVFLFKSPPPLFCCPPPPPGGRRPGGGTHPVVFSWGVFPFHVSPP